MAGQSLEVERSSSAGIEQFQTLEKRAQTEVLMGELEPTLTLRRNETARLRAIARSKYASYHGLLHVLPRSHFFYFFFIILLYYIIIFYFIYFLFAGA